MEVNFYPRPFRTNFEIIDEGKLSETHCFSCSACNECMAGREVVQKGNSLYCWKCLENIFGLKCTACKKLITGLSKMSFIYFNNHAWHKECFCCSDCGKPLDGRDFEQAFRFSYCNKCNERRKCRLG